MRDDIEKLKLKLFWKDFNVEQLKRMMRIGNYFPGNSPYCQCRDCVYYKRSVPPRKKPLHGNKKREPEYDAKCTFGPFFEKAAKRFGLVVVTVPDGDEDDDSWPDDICEHDANPQLEVLDVDAHLVNHRPWNHRLE